MSSSSVNDINEMFDRRLTRPDKVQSRVVNPSASVASGSQKTAFLETLLRPKIEEPSKVGNAFRGQIVDTKFQDVTFFDHRSIETHPKAGHLKHTTSRLDVVHTREK